MRSKNTVKDKRFEGVPFGRVFVVSNENLSPMSPAVRHERFP